MGLGIIFANIEKGGVQEHEQNEITFASHWQNMFRQQSCGNT